METKYWYVEISGTVEGMVNIEKYYTDGLLHSYVDESGILHKRIRVASTFNLDSMACKNMLFDYMEENGGLDKYGANAIRGSYRGLDWVGDRRREYNLMYGKNGKLAVVYTDSKNINTLLKVRDNKGRLANRKKELPTNKFEYGVKKCIKSVLNMSKKINNIEPIKAIPGVKL